MLAALGREADLPKLIALRRLQRLEQAARSRARPLTQTKPPAYRNYQRQ